MPDATPPLAKATARFVRVSPQKARLVVDLIRGLQAEQALHRLQFTNKRIAPLVKKLLQSAIANASDHGAADVDSLYVVRAFVNEGPRQKRIRPAPMGRAYRYQRRTAHIELHLGERPSAANLARRVEAEPAAAPAPAGKPAARRPAARKPARGAAAARKPAAKTAKSGKSSGAARKPAGAKAPARKAAPRKTGPKSK